MLWAQTTSQAISRAWFRLGSRIATSKAMMATTTNSSIRVKAANASFSDDFDAGWTAGDTIPGSNGWVVMYNESTNVTGSALIGAASSGIGTTKNFDHTATPTTGGAARSIDAHIGANGVGQVRVMGNVDSAGATNEIWVGKDTAILTNNVTGTQRNYYVSYKSNGSFTAGMHSPGWTYNGLGAGSWNPGNVGWVELVIDFDEDSGSPGTATLNDVNDTTGAFISQILQLTFPAAPPWAVADNLVAALSVGSSSLGQDNFVVTPEPVTMSILALGAGLVLLRRRR